LCDDVAHCAEAFSIILSPSPKSLLLFEVAGRAVLPPPTLLAFGERVVTEKVEFEEGFLKDRDLVTEVGEAGLIREGHGETGR
jgi:hypothetical protein